MSEPNGRQTNGRRSGPQGGNRAIGGVAGFSKNGPPAEPKLSPFLPPPGAKAHPHREEQPRKFPLAPSEGWVSLFLVVLMTLTVAWSIDDARWVLGRETLTDFLPTAMILGCLWGFASAKVGWSRWLAQGLGAVFGALIIPFLVGATLLDGAGSPHDWYVATANSAVQAYLDLAWRGRALTQEYGHFLLVLGLLCWATGQFAAYATFGRKRPLDGVLVTGIALLTNMSITIRDQLPFLVVYSLAALLLLVRLHSFDEQADWVRRRIGEPGGIAGLYLRRGVVFVTAAVIGSLFLTATASSAPLANAWTDVDQKLIEFGQEVQRFLPGGGPGTRLVGVSFGPTTSISSRWVTDPTPAVVIHVPPADQQPYYWRAVAYDQFNLTGWSWSKAGDVDRAGATALLDDTEDAPLDPQSRKEVTFSVQPAEWRADTVISPDTPVQIDQPTHLTLLDDGRYFGSVRTITGGQPYQVTAEVQLSGKDDPNGLTENKLRAAGRDYPAEISRLYLTLPAGAVGPDATSILNTVKARAPSGNPYDIARTMEQYLRSPAFTYSTDITDLDCGNRSTVECFAHFRRGFCQYYASTMAMLLRVEGIPTRYIQGFLPGERDPKTGLETIRFSNSHAWVEVYFPSYGWVSFDPTGGGLARLAPLPSGPPVPSASIGPRASLPRDEIGPDPTIHSATGSIPPGGSGGQGPNSGLLVAIAVLLVFSVGGAAFALYQRGTGGPVTPDTVWRSVAGLAARFGFGPRPTQTVYEYAADLGDLLPIARPELHVVAQAKVEVAYGHRTLGTDAIQGLREAQRRLRVRLLRLAFRRDRGRWRRR